METKQDSEKARLWHQRISEQRSSGLAKSAFCKEHGLSRFQFDYWVKRLKSKPGHVKKSMLPSPFIKAQVVRCPEPAIRTGLDPKWVAELILHLHQGGVR